MQTETITLGKKEMLEQARMLVESKTNNGQSYAWLVGCMSVFIDEKQAKMIFDVCHEQFGDKVE
jgi:regulatory protein YycI of two-component signal transduction system YycFG